jgi:uncharacterized integral membrane protein
MRDEEKNKSWSVIVILAFLLSIFVARNIAAVFPSSCDWFFVRISHAEQCKLNALRELK